jgi:hypothetical protein
MQQKTGNSQYSTWVIFCQVILAGFFFRIKKLPWTYELGLDMSWASQLSLQSSVRAWIAELSG